MIYLRKTQEETINYDYEHTLITISYDQFLDIIKKYHDRPTTNIFPLISTLHNPCKHKPLCDNYFPVIDCDKIEDKVECIQQLNVRGHSWIEFQSSPDHYWIIVRYSTHIKECIRFMRDLTGDKRYVDVCEKDEKIILRGYRKYASLRSLPVAVDLSIIKNSKRYRVVGSNYKIYKFLKENSSCVFCNWVSEFMSHWAKYSLIEMHCDKDIVSPIRPVEKESSSFSFLKLDL